MVNIQDETLPKSIANKTSKVLSFDYRVLVVLIPSRKDYRHYKMIDDLWYTRKEMSGFKHTYRTEIAMNRIIHNHIKHHCQPIALPRKVECL